MLFQRISILPHFRFESPPPPLLPLHTHTYTARLNSTLIPVWLHTFTCKMFPFVTFPPCNSNYCTCNYEVVMDIHWNHMLNMMGTLHTPQGVNTTVYENNSFCSLQLGCVFMRRVMLSPFNNILPKIKEWKNMEISVKKRYNITWTLYQNSKYLL